MTRNSLTRVSGIELSVQYIPCLMNDWSIPICCSTYAVPLQVIWPIHLTPLCGLNLVPSHCNRHLSCHPPTVSPDKAWINRPCVMNPEPERYYQFISGRSLLVVILFKLIISLAVRISLSSNWEKVSHGLFMDSSWIAHGTIMEPAWILHGFCHPSLI